MTPEQRQKKRDMIHEEAVKRAWKKYERKVHQAQLVREAELKSALKKYQDSVEKERTNAVE